MNILQTNIVYNITIISQGSITVELSDDARFQLNLTYNTVYGVSIVATRAPCPLSRTRALRAHTPRAPCICIIVQLGHMLLTTSTYTY